MADSPTSIETADTKPEADPVVDNNTKKSDVKPDVSVSESTTKKSACKKHCPKERNPNTRNGDPKRKPQETGKKSLIVTPSDDITSYISSSFETMSESESVSNDDDSSSDTSELDYDPHSRRTWTKTKARKIPKREQKKKHKSRYNETDAGSDLDVSEEAGSLSQKQLKKFIRRLEAKQDRILGGVGDSFEDQTFDRGEADIQMSLVLAREKLRSKQVDAKVPQLRRRKSLIDPVLEDQSFTGKGYGQQDLQSKLKKAGSKMAFKRVDQCAYHFPQTV